MTYVGIGLILTVVVYFFARKLYARFPYPMFIPVLTATIIIVATLLLFNYSYEKYMQDVSLLTEMLGVAVVALGYPLFKQRTIIRQYFIPIMSGVFIGTLLGIESGRLLAKVLHIDDVLIYSLLPKSVTTPVAMEIADSLGGIPALAGVFVMIAGISCVVIAPFLMKWFRMDTPLELGLGFGAAAHALGTAKTLEYGEEVAAISSITMTLCAILASFLAPIIVALFS